MLTAVPKRWFSWDFSLLDSTLQPVAELVLSSWRERGSLTVGGVSYRVYRDGLTGPFVLEAPDGSRAATAVKESVFRREFTVGYRDRHFVLKAKSAWRREFNLLSGDQMLGTVVPAGLFTRRAKVEFNDDLPLECAAFVVWLTLLLWKRNSDKAADA